MHLSDLVIASFYALSIFLNSFLIWFYILSISK